MHRLVPALRESPFRRLCPLSNADKPDGDDRWRCSGIEDEECAWRSSPRRPVAAAVSRRRESTALASRFWPDAICPVTMPEVAKRPFGCSLKLAVAPIITASGIQGSTMPLLFRPSRRTVPDATALHEQREGIAEVVKQDGQEQAPRAQAQPDSDERRDCGQRHRDRVEGKAPVRIAEGMRHSEQEA